MNITIPSKDLRGNAFLLLICNRRNKIIVYTKYFISEYFLPSSAEFPQRLSLDKTEPNIDLSVPSPSSWEGLTSHLPQMHLPIRNITPGYHQTLDIVKRVHCALEEHFYGL